MTEAEIRELFFARLRDYPSSKANVWHSGPQDQHSNRHPSDPGKDPEFWLQYG